MKSHYKDTVIANEASIKWYLNQYDEELKGFKNLHGYTSHGANSTALEPLSSAYYCKDNKYYKDPRILDLMHKCIDYMELHHRPNYTIDMRESNFYCAPLFEALNMGRAYRIMEKYNESAEEKALTKRYIEFLPKIAQSLLNGGIHTPNHRWIGAASMFMIGNILDMQQLRDMADAYLNEGIDMDEFGEYSERSPWYNEVCNSSFITIAQETGRMEYLEYARKNLDLMYSYMEPDNTIFTQNSNRKDKHEGNISAITPNDFLYSPYVRMAYIDNNPQYAKMADDMFNNKKKRTGYGAGYLFMYLLDEELKQFEPSMSEYPSTYNIFHNDIVKKRTEDFSASIITRSANFLFIQKGALRCYVRMCSSFFAIAQFIPKHIKKVDREEIGDNDNTEIYELTMSAHGEYYGPMPTKPSTAVWKDMDHSQRPVNNEVDLEYKVTIELKDDEVVMHVNTFGCDLVPFKLEFCFTTPSYVQYDGLIHEVKAGEHLCTKQEEVTIIHGHGRLKLSGLFAEHTYHKDMRGSIGQSAGDFTLYCTGFTHIDKTIRIKGI